MTNIFTQSADDPDATQDELLGPSYDYYKQINSPSQLNMSSHGSFSTLEKNMKGMFAYVDLLVSGSSKASKNGKPLGNKFFLQTGATCTDTKTQKDVDRYVYIDNVPNGSIPFVSPGMGDDSLSDFRGLIPGALGNISAFNPFTILQGFVTGTDASCEEITMEVIDSDDNSSTESKHVLLTDIKSISPCSFSDTTNPITNASCTEAFTTSNLYNTKEKDLVLQIYHLSVGLVGLYILYKLIKPQKL
jgi:hypothetical protein